MVTPFREAQLHKKQKKQQKSTKIQTTKNITARSNGENHSSSMLIVCALFHIIL